MARNSDYQEKNRPILTILYVLAVIALVAALVMMYMNYRERRGEYLGDTVQVIPHITDEICRRMRLPA